MRGADPGRICALLLGAVVALGAAGCESGGEELALPTEAELEGLYGDRASVRLNGNVVDVRASQPAEQLQRGGDLWAKVGPYIFVFSPQTQEVFDEYPGVAAVRVRTVTEAGEWVAEATLRRDALNAITWNEALRRVSRARTEGTQKPGLLEELVDYGEDLTEHRYNPAYVEER